MFCSLIGFRPHSQQEPPNFQFGRGLKPLLPRSRSVGVESEFYKCISASCPLPFQINHGR